MPLSQRQKQYLKIIGIPLYRERNDESLEDFELQSFHTENSESDLNKSENIIKTLPEIDPNEAEIKPDKHDVTEVSVHEVLQRSELPDDWSRLNDQVKSCQRCDLHTTRTQIVFGAGETKADWMIIGEAPGAEEDKQGEPFVGRAGQLLTTILESIGLGRNKVYIANILKCRPPNNRDPKKSEAAQCRAYLEQQIALVDPKIIICLGRIASQNLLQSDDPISRMRGSVHSIQHPLDTENNIPVVVTYHPAYLLRSPSQKRKVWEDLKLAFSELVS
jgi:DNA polymerase